MSLFQAELPGRRDRSEPVAIPDFTLQILRLAEQGGFAFAGDHQPGLGLGKATQIIKVTVLTVQKIGVTIALLLGRTGHDGNAFGTQHSSQFGAALSVYDGRWFIHGLSCSII